MGRKSTNGILERIDSTEYVCLNTQGLHLARNFTIWFYLFESARNRGATLMRPRPNNTLQLLLKSNMPEFD